MGSPSVRSWAPTAITSPGLYPHDATELSWSRQLHFAQTCCPFAGRSCATITANGRVSRGMERWR